jgi:hypothetical protein
MVRRKVFVASYSCKMKTKFWSENYFFELVQTFTIVTKLYY